jgi:CBS domain containing-hemolysin-like protein
VDNRGELIGLVTLDDILMLLCEEFDSIRGLLQRESPASVAAP